jgi:hypothetical protein
MNRSRLLGAILCVGALAAVLGCGEPDPGDAGSDATVDRPAAGGARVVLTGERPPDDGDVPPTVNAVEVPDDVLVDAALVASVDGLDYSVQVGEKMLGEGHLDVGDTGTINVYGVLVVTFTVTYIWPDEVDVDYLVSGLFDDEGWSSLPFGSYDFYWGDDRGRVPPPHVDNIQAWFDFQTDRVTYHGDGYFSYSNYPYSFDADGEITQEGQVADVLLSWGYTVRLTFHGIGEDRKDVDVDLIQDGHSSPGWELTVPDLPSALLLMRVNFDGQ